MSTHLPSFVSNELNVTNLRKAAAALPFNPKKPGLLAALAATNDPKYFMLRAKELISNACIHFDANKRFSAAGDVLMAARCLIMAAVKMS